LQLALRRDRSGLTQSEIEANWPANAGWGTEMFITFIGTGIPWYKREDYSRIRDIMTDSDSMPRSYLRWQKINEELEGKLAAAGRMPQRVNLDPCNFTTWCMLRGLSRDRLARTQFAADSSNWAKQG
jgi:hypothetical protein